MYHPENARPSKYPRRPECYYYLKYYRLLLRQFMPAKQKETHWWHHRGVICTTNEFYILANSYKNNCTAVENLCLKRTVKVPLNYRTWTKVFEFLPYNIKGDPKNNQGGFHHIRTAPGILKIERIYKNRKYTKHSYEHRHHLYPTIVFFYFINHTKV